MTGYLYEFVFVVGHHTLDVKGTNGAPVKGGGKEKNRITLMLAAKSGL